MGRMATQKHRSHWTARIQDPSLNPHRFLPTPVPSRPISKIVAPPQVVEVKRETQPPTCARDPGAFCILDRYNDYRAYISPDGTCTNNANQIIGYINIDSSEAGSTEQEFLGSVNPDWQVEDDEDVYIGEIDPGRALLLTIQVLLLLNLIILEVLPEKMDPIL